MILRIRLRDARKRAAPGMRSGDRLLEGANPALLGWRPTELPGLIADLDGLAFTMTDGE